jgi:hypothetical protein
MTAHQIDKTVCRRCGAPTAESAREGNPIGSRPLSDPAAAPPRPAHSRGVILVLLFVALGPLAIPILWRSDRFSRFWKIVLTVLVLVVTALVLWLARHLADTMVIEPIRKFREMEGL